MATGRSPPGCRFRHLSLATGDLDAAAHALNENRL